MRIVDMDAIAIPEDIIRSTHHRYPPRIQIVPTNTLIDARQEKRIDIDIQIKGVLSQEYQ